MMKTSKISGLFGLLLLCAAATGCFKKVTTDTTVIVKTLLETESGGERVPAAGTTAYAVYPDSEEWTILSWEDAVAQRITSTESGEQRTGADVEGQPYERYQTGNYTALPLTRTPAMVVVLDPATRMYAYMFKRLEAENLPETFLTLIFHAWKTAPYTEGSKAGATWHVFPAPAAETPDPGQEEQGGGGAD